jgi:NAD(P)-dependent dehydrogenase (short-subunit alcohol dehydrogenase family)
MNPFSLEGKTIVVSGASSGIGRQCAISSAAMGARVMLLGRNEERLKETYSMMDKKQAHQIFKADLSKPEEVKLLATEILENAGRIDGLLNVAGISSTLLLKSVNEEKLHDMFSANVFSSVYLTKELTKMGHFSKDGGSIVFLSSIMGTFGETGKSVYAMTKGALIAGARSLACELAPKNIRVNVISPGLIITPINENLPHITDMEKLKRLEEMHLLGLGNPKDVANACVYLLSDASKWVTGTNLFVDGGYTVR